MNTSLKIELSTETRSSLDITVTDMPRTTPQVSFLASTFSILLFVMLDYFFSYRTKYSFSAVIRILKRGTFSGAQTRGVMQ